MGQADLEHGKAGSASDDHLAASEKLPQPSGESPRSRLQNAPACPECGSTKVWRDGYRTLSNGGRVQRWLCRNCWYRFSRNDTQVSFLSKPLKAPKPINIDCRVCAPDVGVENSAGAVKALEEEKANAESRAAGATEKTSDIQGKILEFLWWMKKQGYKEATIESYGNRLRRLVKLGACLSDPESVKNIIAEQSWSLARKEAVVNAYNLFAKWHGIKWEKPVFKPLRKFPFIPYEREIDDLVAGCTRHIAVFLQIARETGARAGEIFNLKWIDVDAENRTITITPEKGSEPRILRVSARLLTMLSSLSKASEYIFKPHYSSLRSMQRCFERCRKRIAHKLGNPRISKITFHTLRHWKGTMLYKQTRDILFVMKTLGHKNIKNTMLYVNLAEALGKCDDDEYVSAAARTLDEVRRLVEQGFEYICEVDGYKVFRKRK